MPGIKDLKSNTPKYCEKSIMDINSSLAEIDKGIFLQMTDTLRNLIAEFAATFAIKQWAVKHGWNFRGGLFRKASVSFEDMKLFAEAQKHGALFRSVSIHSTMSYFTKWDNLQLEAALSGLETLNNYGVDARIISESLNSGLHVNACNFFNCSNEDMRVFLEEMTTAVELKKLALCRDCFHVDFGIPPDSEVLKLICSKFKPGAALQCLESLCLSGMSTTISRKELIGELLKGGVKLKSLASGQNNHRNGDRILLAQSILNGAGLEITKFVED